MQPRNTRPGSPVESKSSVGAGKQRVLQRKVKRGGKIVQSYGKDRKYPPKTEVGCKFDNYRTGPNRREKHRDCAERKRCNRQCRQRQLRLERQSGARIPQKAGNGCAGYQSDGKRVFCACPSLPALQGSFAAV